MIFNKKNIDGVSEVNALVGVAYYGNNEFAGIKPHIIDETRTIISHIGKETYKRAEEYYLDEFEPELVPEDKEKTQDHKLVVFVQTAIALMAIFRYNQSNIMSHEDTGRKLKMDVEHEKTPWEWMFDRDDAALLRRAYLAIDALIDFLEEEQIKEWLESENRVACRSLLVASCKEFERAYPIDQSARFYYTLIPFIREAQEKTLPLAMSLEVYNNLVSKYKSNSGMSDSEKHLLALVQSYLPLRTIEIACMRLSVSVFPEGVAQRFVSGGAGSGRHGSNAASDETRRRYALSIGTQADTALDDIKRYIQHISADKLLYPIMPENNPKNNFFIL